jgi:hypothetical protein
VNFHRGAMREMLVKIKSIPMLSFYWLNGRNNNFAKGNKYQVELNVGERDKYIGDANKNMA